MSVLLKTRSGSIYYDRLGRLMFFRPVSLLGSFFLVSIPIFGQTHICGNGLPGTPTPSPRVADCSEQGADFQNFYKYKENWIPDPTTDLVKTLHVNIHVWQKNDGTGNLDDTPTNRARLQQMIVWTDDKFRANSQRIVPLPYPTPPHLSTSNIKIVLDGVYFYQDPTPNNVYYQPTSGQYGHVQTLDAYVEQNHPERTKALAIHITGSSFAGAAGYSDFGSIETFYKTNPPMNTDPVHDYFIGSEHWSHEIGHSFDLWHTYDNQTVWNQACGSYQLDFLWDVFDTTVPCGNCDACLWPPGPTNNNIMGNGDNWNKSTLQIGIMHRSTVLENFNNVRNGVPYGVRDHITGYHPIPKEITSDETWDFSMKMYQDIVIRSGVTLTVKCKLMFVPQAKIVVEPGAKLVVDGGTLTNEFYYDSFWSGIQVWGNNAHDQSPYGAPQHQGIVILKNDAIIEHAIVGISMQEPGVPGTHGGVVQATDAKFLNCSRGVQFLSYNWTVNNVERSNHSFFNRCEFIVDQDYRGGTSFDAHATLWDVIGVRFTQCDFVNAQDVPGTVQNSEDLGVGIRALDAHFTVKGKCASIPYCDAGAPIPPCAPDDLQPSRFIGLDHGINAAQSATGRTFFVSECEFTNNVCGIYASAVNNFIATRNKFVVGDRQVALTNPLETFWNGHHRGIFSLECNGFRIEENTFERDPASQIEVEGIVVNKTGTHNDQVYKNTSISMDHGVIAEHVCVDISQPYFQGLTFSCNEANNNVGRDLVYRVPPILGGMADGSHCMRYVQGSVNQEAGNTFTPYQNGGYTYFNYENENDANTLIRYFYGGPPAQPDPGGVIGVWLPNIGAVPQNSCPSRITCGNVEQVRSAKMLQHQQAKQSYLNLKYAYESLIDGGDFEELEETIMLSWPEDAWELRNELMAESPYLSVEILFEAAEKNILPDAMMLEICLANPDATREENFVQWMREEAPNPLPEYMIQQIVASWESETLRSNLEAGIGEQLTTMTVSNDHLIGLLRNDSVPGPLDSVLIRWKAGPDLASRYGEIQTVIEMGDLNAAETLLNDLENEYELKENEVLEREAMLTYISIFRDVESSGQPLMELDVGIRDAFTALADEGNTRAATLAQNLLCFGYGQCWPPSTGGSMTQRSLVHNSSTGDPESAELNVYPNPASTYVTLEHQLAGSVEGTVLSIVDISGKEVHRIAINSSPAQELWDIRSVERGTYLIELRRGGALIDAQRLVVR